MKHTLLLCLAAAMLAACVSAAVAAQADVGSLIREFKGESAAVKRSPADLQAVYAAVLDSLLPGMADADPGKGSSAMNNFSVICLRAARPGAEEERAAVSRAILPKLAATTPPEVRAWLLRQLQWIGKAESVAALVPLLDEADANVRDCARRALEANPSPEAGAALRAALARAATREPRVAMINALAARRDADAVDALAAMMDDADEQVAQAAAAGLGRIGTAKADAALAALEAGATGKLLVVVQDARLRCADQVLADGKKDAAAAIYQTMYAQDKPTTIRVAALRGILTIMGREEGAFQDDKSGALLRELLAGKDAKLQPFVLPLLLETQGPGAAKTFAAILPNVLPAAQVSLLDALRDRADPSTRPAVLDAMKSTDDSVRVAALKALGAVGTADDVAALAKTAATGQGSERDAARWGLDHLPGDAASAAMIAALPQADAKTRPELIRTLAARRATAAMPEIMKAAAGADVAARMEAIKGIEAMGDEKSISVLLNDIGRPPDEAERQAAEKALGAVCSRATNKDAAADELVAAMRDSPLAPSSPGDPLKKRAILAALPRVGNQKGLDAVRAALRSANTNIQEATAHGHAVVDSDAAIQEAAIRALADWPDAAAAPDLLAIAQNDPKVEHQVIAIRGMVRMASAAGMGNADKVALLAKTLAAAKRPEDKRLVLGPLGGISTVEALRLVAPLMDDANLKEEAAAAAARIAKNMPATLPAEVRPAMEKVLKVSTSAATRKDAQDVLGKVPK